MCLTINSTFHKKNFFNRFKPLKAVSDILVYKLLVNGEENEYITPIQCFPVKFENGIAELSVVRFSFDTICGITSVYKGIHSCQFIVNPDNITDDPSINYHLAIIPKGTKYFLGDCFDVVSKKLLIFETKEDFQKYYKNHLVEIFR